VALTKGVSKGGTSQSPFGVLYGGRHHFSHAGRNGVGNNSERREKRGCKESKADFSALHILFSVHSLQNDSKNVAVAIDF
jgi:hypothetical protein